METYFKSRPTCTRMCRWEERCNRKNEHKRPFERHAPDAAVFLLLLSSAIAIASASVGSSGVPASGEGVLPADNDRATDGGPGMIPSIWEEELDASDGGRVPKCPAEKLWLVCCWCGGGRKPKLACCWGCEDGL